MQEVAKEINDKKVVIDKKIFIKTKEEKEKLKELKKAYKKNPHFKD